MKCVSCNGYFNESPYNHRFYGYSKQGEREYICKSCMLIKVLKYEAWEPFDKRMMNEAKIPFERFKRKESEE